MIASRMKKFANFNEHGWAKFTDINASDDAGRKRGSDKCVLDQCTTITPRYHKRTLVHYDIYQARENKFFFF